MKLEKLTITINFGNAAMQTVDDAGRALKEVAEKMIDGREPTKVMDLNGNSVGKIEYE